MPFARDSRAVGCTSRRLRMVGLLGLLLAAASGCGSGLRTYPVKGKVVMKDGTPLTEGRISFEAVDGSLSATGRIDRQGCFQLQTRRAGDGVPAGRYRAVVVPDVYPDPDSVQPPPRFHSRYRRYETSGLEFTVKEDDNFFEIALDPQ